MTKKIGLIIGSILILLLSLIFIFSGGARKDVYLKSFDISENQKTMTLNVGVSSSSGYIRKMKRTSGSTNYYFTFYSTFGFNSKAGSKDTFEILLDDNVDEIYFYTGNKGYKKVLEKNNGSWIMSGYNREIQKIIDKSENIKDFSCDMAHELFYEDSNYTYYYPCIKGNYIVVLYENGEEETVKEALLKGIIDIKDLDNAGIKYYKRQK